MPDQEGKKSDSPKPAAAGSGATGNQNAFIERAVPDPANPQPLSIVSGYRGASSEAGQTRLYLDPSLSAYVDIPEADVAFEFAVPPEKDPLGAVTLWVKQDSKLNYRSTAKAGSEQQMFGQYPFPGQAGLGAAAGGAAPQATIPQTVTGGLTQTLTATFTHPVSPFCPPHSPFIFHCPPPPSPTLFACTHPSPFIVQCTHSPLPHCFVSPNCTPGATVSPLTPHTTPQTTPQTSLASFAGAEAFGAAPQATSIPTFPTQTPHTVPLSPIPVHCTFPQTPFCPTFLPHQCLPSPQLFCTHPSPLIVHCTQPSPFIVQCTHSPLPHCAVSPNCTPGATISPLTPHTTPQTTPQTSLASFAGAEAFGAAPQATSIPTFPTQTPQTVPLSPIPVHCTFPHTPLCPTFLPHQCLPSPQLFCTHPSPFIVHCTVPPSPQILHCTQPSPLVQCTHPSPLVLQCTHSPFPHCVASPNCTPGSPLTPLTPQTPQTTPQTSLASFAGGAAAPQAFTGTVPTHVTLTLTTPFTITRGGF